MDIILLIEKFRLRQIAEDSILALKLVKWSFYDILLALEEAVVEKL